MDTPRDVCPASIHAPRRLLARCRPGDGRAATAAVVRRWRSPEFLHRPAATVRKGADVTRTTCPDSPIKSWRVAHAVALVPEPIKVEAPEAAGYEVRRGTVRADCSRRGGSVVPQQMRNNMFLWQQRPPWKDGYTVKGNIFLHHKEERNGKCPNNPRRAYH